MAKLRRGVGMEQLQDDLERILNVQESRTVVPDMTDVRERQFLMIDDDSGEIVFRIGGKLWKITATEVT